MSVDPFKLTPRTETIVVPDYVPLGRCGAYVSHYAANFLDDLGAANYNRNTVNLKALDARTYSISFMTSQRFTLPREELTRYEEEAKKELSNRAASVESRGDREAGGDVVEESPGLLRGIEAATAKLEAERLASSYQKAPPTISSPTKSTKQR